MTKVTQVEMLIHQPLSTRVTTGRFSSPRILDLLAQQREEEFVQTQFALLALLYFFAFLWAATIKINEVSFAFMFSVLNWLR